MLDECGCFCTYGNIPEDRQEGIDILTLNAIKSAIPKIWVSWLKENPKVDQGPTRWELIQNIKNYTKINYWKLIRSSKKQPKSAIEKL